MRLRLTAAFLPLVLLTGCGNLCFFLCTDQTHIQRGYVDERDQCRQVAEMKLGLEQPEPAASAPGSARDKAAKAKLVSLFSECMNNKGWSVPDPAAEKKDQAAGGASQPGGIIVLTPPPPPQQQMEDARAARAAECAFARQAADISIASRKRAEACDLECRESKRLAPEAPESAACP